MGGEQIYEISRGGNRVQRKFALDSKITRKQKGGFCYDYILRPDDEVPVYEP